MDRNVSFTLFAAALVTVACSVTSQPANHDGSAQVSDSDAELRRGAYLGETEPGIEPRLFAKGLISTGLSTRDTAVSADGTEIYFSLMGQGAGTLVMLRRNTATDGTWSEPEVVSFSGRYNDIEPFLHPSGSHFYFASQRPLPGEEESGDWNLWVVPRSGQGWDQPQPLNAINTDGNEFYPSVTRDGTLYFTTRGEDTLGREDLYRSRLVDGNYTPPENLGSAVNSPHDEFNAWVAPDESMLIFGSVREGDSGGGDLYISFRDASGTWLPAQNLGPEINSPRLDYCPFVSPDGKFLFFTSNRTVDPQEFSQRNYRQRVDAYLGPLNGNDSIYWVDATVLETKRN